jgi:hypothetical protein
MMDMIPTTTSDSSSRRRDGGGNIISHYRETLSPVVFPIVGTPPGGGHRRHLQGPESLPAGWWKQWWQGHQHCCMAQIVPSHRRPLPDLLPVIIGGGNTAGSESYNVDERQSWPFRVFSRHLSLFWRNSPTHLNLPRGSRC